MARPLKEIDKRDFEKLCALQCRESEICSFFDITDKTLNSWCKRTYHKNFSEVFAEKRGAGLVSLRRNQWRLAETNPTMAIFLGKQFLGQSDKVEVKTTISEEVTNEIDGIIDEFKKKRNNTVAD